MTAVFSVGSGASIDAFLTQWKPSNSPPTLDGWIWIHRSSSPKSEPNQADMEALWAQVTQNTTPTPEAVDTIAAATNVVSGKWLVYAATTNVDETWDRIARALNDGVLGSVAKVSTSDGTGRHVICVYTDDYFDTEDVMRVRGVLRDRCGITSKIYYKPDIYTHLGIYAKNPWRLKATLYGA